MPFEFGQIPSTERQSLQVFFQKTFKRLEAYIRREQYVALYTAAPVNPEEGMIVRADGTSWNPGSGRGFYGYDNGSWTFLG